MTAAVYYINIQVLTDGKVCGDDICSQELNTMDLKHCLSKGYDGTSTDFPNRSLGHRQILFLFLQFFNPLYHISLTCPQTQRDKMHQLPLLLFPRHLDGFLLLGHTSCQLQCARIHWR